MTWNLFPIIFSHRYIEYQSSNLVLNWCFLRLLSSQIANKNLIRSYDSIYLGIKCAITEVGIELIVKLYRESNLQIKHTAYNNVHVSILLFVSTGLKEKHRYRTKPRALQTRNKSAWRNKAHRRKTWQQTNRIESTIRLQCRTRSSVYRVAFGASVSLAKENLQTAQPFMFLCQRDITVKRILHRLSVSNVCFVRFCGTATKAATGINLGTEIQFDPKRARELFIGAIRSPTLRYKSRGGTRTDVTISGVPWNWDRWCNYA